MEPQIQKEEEDLIVHIDLAFFLWQSGCLFSTQVENTQNNFHKVYLGTEQPHSLEVEVQPLDCPQVRENLR